STRPSLAAYLYCAFLGHPFTGSCLGGGNHLMPFAGSKVTLKCMLPEKGDMMYWYKQTVGEKPTLVSTKYTFDSDGMFYDGFKDSQRFQLSPDYHLDISNLQASDTGTYYCATTKHYMPSFSEATSAPVDGDALILKCSVHVGGCDGRPRVHWFKQPGESAPGVLYSRGGGGGGDQCERKPDGPANSCIYSLPMHNVSSEQAGNYYCAVAACGYLLFGKATTLNDSLLIYVLGGALAFTSVLVVILALVIGTFRKGDVLYYVAVEQMKSGRSKKHRDDTWSECVYFNVK
uniref:Ig-like domain-containing protein n=1 Tax=Neogobius melanostomus TaxID=47308 RepID=A0A8C6STM6_9GOBI